MQYLVNIFPQSILVISAIAFFILLIWALLTAPWRKLVDNESSHVYFAAILGVLFLWLIRANVVGDISFHLLSSSILLLMFGCQFAFFAILIVQIALVFISGLDPYTIPINMLVLVVVPLVITRSMLILALKFLPHHFFIYVFVNCFFAAAFSMIASSLLAFGLFALFADAHAYHQLSEFLPLVLLMSFPEGALTTMILSGMVAYKPQWVASFHDRIYIIGK